MGGDHAPQVTVEGAVRALKERPDGLHVVLAGPEATIREHLAEYDTDGLALSVVDAPDLVGMDDAPTLVLKRKRQSSIHVGIGLCKEGKADGFVSAGNTGAVMAVGFFVMGRLPGVSRPTLPGIFPTTKSFATVVDVGANVDCKPDHLVQFALMGDVYARKVLGRDNPTVGLLNIGEEPGKGNEVVKEVHKLLEAQERLNFVGNIEGRDVMHHVADVIVCDGFVGNIILKLGESLTSVLPDLIRQQVIAQNMIEHAPAIKQVFKGVVKPFNYENYGGVPLLGVDGTIIIGHGGSSAKAVEQMIYRAAEVAEGKVSQAIASAIDG